jgi:hypothetical protein
MIRTAWSKRINGILRSEGSKPVKETLAAYDRLLESTQQAARGSVSDWDVAEVMFLRSFFLEQRGRFRDALAGYLKVAELRRSHITGHGHSLASTLEAAVAVAVKAGERRKALLLAQEVVKLRGEFPYASSALEEAVKLLHDEQRRRNRRAKAKQLAKGPR